MSSLGKVDPTLGILQKDWGITNASSKTPCLGTRNLGPCFALIIYNPQSKEAALAHLDDKIDIASINTIFQEMLGGTTKDKLQVSLVGGWTCAASCVKVAKFLKEGGYNVNIDRLFARTCPVMPDETTKVVNGELIIQGKSYGPKKNFSYGFVIIDSRTGEIRVGDDQEVVLNFPGFEESRKRFNTTLSDKVGVATFVPIFKRIDARAKN